MNSNPLASMDKIANSIWIFLSGLPLIPSSKAAAESGLSKAELSLVIFALVIGFGLVCEDWAERKETKWDWMPSHMGWNWKRIFAWVVAAGVIAELFSDAAIWMSSDALQTISDGEILSLNTEIAPRRLLQAEQNEIAGSLAKFASKSVWISSYALDAEGAVLGFQITDVLKNAWISTNSEGLMTIQGSGSISLGVHITGKDKTLVKALLDGFGKYEAVSPEEPFRGGFISMGGASPVGPIPDASIFVGVKPLPK